MEQRQIKHPSEIITSRLAFQFLDLGKWITCSEVGWVKKINKQWYSSSDDKLGF